MVCQCLCILSLTVVSDSLPPVLSIAGGTAEHEVYVHQRPGMPYGPQEYVVDWQECIYVHDINTYTTPPVNRIVKFDSAGQFLFIIDTRSAPSLNNVWFGPITIDPLTNDLIVSGSGLPEDKITDSSSTSSAATSLYLFRFSPLGALLEVTRPNGTIRGNVLVYDYDGNFYSIYVDGGYVIGNDLTLKQEMSKLNSTRCGFSQWSPWVTSLSAPHFTAEDADAGKHIVELVNLSTREKKIFVFYDPPHYARSGGLEGIDKDGNVYLTTVEGFIRINPQTNSAAVVRRHDLGMPRTYGDVGHAPIISPNGYVYWAGLVYDQKGHLRYNIYRITPDMFVEKECTVTPGHE